MQITDPTSFTAVDDFNVMKFLQTNNKGLRDYPRKDDDMRTCVICLKSVVKGTGGRIRTALMREKDKQSVTVFMCHTCFFTEPESVFRKGWLWVDSFKNRYDLAKREWSVGWIHTPSTPSSKVSKSPSPPIACDGYDTDSD